MDRVGHEEGNEMTWKVTSPPGLNISILAKEEFGQRSWQFNIVMLFMDIHIYHLILLISYEVDASQAHISKRGWSQNLSIYIICRYR